MSNNQFKLQINLTNAYKGEDGNAYLEGIASGPEVDLTGERMSETALNSMVESIQRRLVEFRDAHKDEWNEDLGEIVALSVTPDNHLLYKAKLDLNLSGAKDLWYRMTELGKKYGVSIGGSVVKAGFEYVAEIGKEVFTYFDVDLHEISITRQAAYQYSFANAVTKSLPKKEEPMSKADTVEKTDDQQEEVVSTTKSDQETVTTSTNDTNLSEEEAAVSDATAEAPKDTPTPSTEEDSQEETEKAAEQSDAETEESEEEPTEEEPADAEEQSDQAAEEEVATEDSAAEDVSKKLTDAQAEVDTLTKSLTEAKTKVEELTKSLFAKDEELATVQKSLQEKETELEKINARKGIVFDKFTGHEAETVDQKEVTKSSHEQFASFVVHGAK